MIIKKELDFGNKTQRQLISVLEKAGFDPIPDYNYLLIITISSLTKEKVYRPKHISISNTIT
jgi:hypothetical protein